MGIILRIINYLLCVLAFAAHSPHPTPMNNRPITLSSGDARSLAGNQFDRTACSPPLILFRRVADLSDCNTCEHSSYLLPVLKEEKPGECDLYKAVCQKGDVLGSLHRILVIVTGKSTKNF